MTESPQPVSDRALQVQIRELESRLIQRRQSMRRAASDIQARIAMKLTSPGMLLSAAGIGVALEQANHHRGGSFLGMLNAVNSCIQLMMSFSSSTPTTVASFTDSSE